MHTLANEHKNQFDILSTLRCEHNGLYKETMNG